MILYKVWLELSKGMLVEREGGNRASGAATFSGYRVGDIERRDMEKEK